MMKIALEKPQALLGPVTLLFSRVWSGYRAILCAIAAICALLGVDNILAVAFGNSLDGAIRFT